MQYSVLHKQELAHEESIWCVAWGRTKNSEEKSDVEMKDPDDGNSSAKNENDANDFIVTGSLDDTVKIWNVKDNSLKLQKQLSGNSLGVVSVAVSSDGQTIASSSLDSGLCIWKTETGQMLNQAALGPVDLWTVAFSPDDKYVISGSHEGKISLYSVETAKPEQVLDPQNGKFTLSIAYVSENHLIFPSVESYNCPKMNTHILFRVPMVNTLQAEQLMESLISSMLPLAKLLKHLKVMLCLYEVYVFHPIPRCF